MNFDLSEDVIAMRHEVRRLLRDRYPPGAVRSAVDAGQPFDRAAWSLLGELGWLGVSIPEQYGGSGLGYEALAMIAGELAAVVAPIPYLSSIKAAEAILRFGTEQQRERWLPSLASGAVIGCVALAGGESSWQGPPTVVESALSGVLLPVSDGDIADLLVTEIEGKIVAIELAQDAAKCEILGSLDLVRASAKLSLDRACTHELSGGGKDELLDRLAIITAFEQVGGAEAALAMAADYAKQRFAFGRAVGSFEAIKHKLADVYVALELARSNAYYGIWALDHPEALPIAASAARISANEAYGFAARENIQVHGGMGFTWESDCHLHYRRARLAVTEHGSQAYWRDRLIDHLDRAEAA